MGRRGRLGKGSGVAVLTCLPEGQDVRQIRKPSANEGSVGDSEMAQWAKVSAMSPEDLSSNPRDQCWKAKTASCKLLSDPHMGCGAWSPTPHLHTNTFMHS